MALLTGAWTQQGWYMWELPGTLKWQLQQQAEVSTLMITPVARCAPQQSCALCAANDRWRLCPLQRLVGLDLVAGWLCRLILMPSALSAHTTTNWTHLVPYPCLPAVAVAAAAAAAAAAARIATTAIGPITQLGKYMPCRASGRSLSQATGPVPS